MGKLACALELAFEEDQVRVANGGIPTNACVVLLDRKVPAREAGRNRGSYPESIFSTGVGERAFARVGMETGMHPVGCRRIKRGGFIVGG